MVVAEHFPLLYVPLESMDSLNQIFTAVFNRLKPGCFLESRAERGSPKNNCGLLKRESL
jgi:hypothetical protein